MRKWIVVASALALIGVGIALVWPRTPAGDDGSSNPDTSQADQKLPEFTQVAVTSSQPGAGLALTGRVLDQGGKPVPNARVSLSASAQQDLSTISCDVCGRPILTCEAGETAPKIAALLHQQKGLARGALSTTSDAEGKFRFENLSGVSFTVFAEAAGFGAALHERAAPGDPVDLYLPPPRAVVGAVRDDFGRPVPTAHVHAVSRRLPLDAQTTVNSDGSFALRGLGEGPFFLVAEAPGFLPAVERDAEADGKPADLRLLRPRTLEVTVRVDGKPVDGNVSLSAFHEKRSVNAKNGIARITDLFPQEVTVTASFGNRASAPRLVDLQDEVTKLTLDLEAGALISLTVVDEAGQPVPKPEAALMSPRGELLFHKKANTGELIQFGPVAAGNYSVQAWAEAYQPLQQPVKVTDKETQLELTLQKGVVIRGRVIDEYERPAPGVSVLVQPTGGAVFADEDGRFVAPVPTPGLYTLHAHHSDWGGGQVEVQAPADDVRLALEPKGGVEITVSSGGRRVEGAEAIMWMAREDVYRSDRASAADGVVVMRGLQPGNYTLAIRHPDYLPTVGQKVQVVDGQMAHVSVELEEGASISGRVQDEHGSAIVGAFIVASPALRDRPTYSDGSGHFELHALKPNAKYTIGASHPSFDVSQPARGITPGKDEVVITMVRRKTYRGRVVNESGDPIRHFRVDDREVDSADGRFELPLQSIGERVICSVEATGYEPTTVDREGTQELGDIALKRSALVSGTVRDEQGQVVSDAVVSCDMCDQEAMSGADGRYTLARPTSVLDLVIVARKGALSGSAQVDLRKTQDAEIVLKPRTKVTGTVYREDGTPAAGEMVEAIGMEQVDGINFVTGRDGRFSTEIPAGHYRFSVGDARMYGPEPVLLIEISGREQVLDLGPSPGSSALSFHVRPEGGYALWVVRGQVPVPRNPYDLNQASWAQFIYQPNTERVTLTGFPPGRYTVVWTSFHSYTPGDPPKVRVVDVPARGEIDLTTP